MIRPYLPFRIIIIIIIMDDDDDDDDDDEIFLVGEKRKGTRV